MANKRPPRKGKVAAPLAAPLAVAYAPATGQIAAGTHRGIILLWEMKANGPGGNENPRLIQAAPVGEGAEK
jgi:hypothetical protein